MKIFDEEIVVDIFCHHTEPVCLHRAIADLQSDLCRVSGKTATVKQYLPCDEAGYLVVGSLENEAFRTFLMQQQIVISEIEGRWERYLLQTFGAEGENLLICGSDRRGTMWGVYDFCERYLGVDPMYFWADNPPQTRESLCIEPVDFVSEPATFRFRGFFLNDEDLLTEWLNGGGKRYVDYPYYHQVTHQEVIEKVLETMLRLRQNLVMPASLLDIDNPAEENLVRMSSERGLFVSQHHVEPLGVSHFAWENYWRKQGKEVAPSFVSNPGAFEEIWTYYVRKWAQYDNIIWQLGLRGRGDRPVWVNDPDAPESMAARGKLISDALTKQVEILKRVVGEDFIATATLWMEGSELHEEGYLEFPQNTIIVFADHGSTQMMLDDFFETGRELGREYGVYHHVAFWAAGPRLVAGTSLDKLYFNYKNAVEKGDTAYSILNVGNLREFPLGAEAVARMTWAFDSFDPDAYLDAWLARHFGAGAVEPVRELYRAFMDAYYKLDNRLIEGQQVLLDGMVRLQGLKLLDMLLQGKMPSDGLEALGKWRKVYAGPAADASPEVYVSFYKKALAEGLANWRAVYGLAFGALPAAQTQFYVDHFVVQLEIIMGLYAWCYHLCLAAEASLAGEAIIPHVERAVFAMQELLMDRKKAEHGKWANWYRGDKKMNLPELLEKTRALLA